MKIKKVDAKCEYLGECGSYVWAVERRMGNKWVSQKLNIKYRKIKKCNDFVLNTLNTNKYSKQT